MQYIRESEKHAEEAKKHGLTAAGYGLWRDKTGKVVKKSTEHGLKDVRGSEANLKHYHTNIPPSREANHAEHDMSSDIVAAHETPGTWRDSQVTRHHIIETSAVHPKKAAALHDALVKAGYKHTKSVFGHQYENGKTAVSISLKPDGSHKRGSFASDHHTVVMQTAHISKPKKPKTAGG